MQLLCALEDELGEFVSAFEGISGAALRAVAQHPSAGLPPFATVPPHAVLFEISSSIGREQALISTRS